MGGKRTIKEFIPLVRFLDHFILLFDSRLGQPLGQGKDSKCKLISLPNPRQEVKFFIKFTVHVRCLVGDLTMFHIVLVTELCPTSSAAKIGRMS